MQMRVAVLLISICLFPFLNPITHAQCVDQDPNVFPSQIWRCDVFNDLDDNCNGLIDEELEVYVFYADLDADGYGYGSGAEQYGCVIPDSGVSGNNLDCNDLSADINPSMIELVGNDIDEDCDGNVGTLILQFSESNKFEISPNPVMNTLTLTWKLSDMGNTYEIYHSNGKQIERGIITDSVTRIDVSQWPTGVYIIQINSQKQKFNVIR